MEATFEVTEFNEEDFTDLCDTAGYCIGYWATKATLTKDYYHVFEEGEAQPVSISREHMMQTINKIISGQLQVSESLRRNVRYAFGVSDIGDLDGYDVDAIIQLCIFGEVIYA
jgi:hypothetical protein